jgi:hypothetical protein
LDYQLHRSKSRIKDCKVIKREVVDWIHPAHEGTKGGHSTSLEGGAILDYLGDM